MPKNVTGSHHFGLDASCLSGDHVLRQLRSFTNIPVIVVSAKTMVQSKIDLLRMGADDYMTKPFNLYELLARIEANLKRSAPVSQKEDIHLRYKDIEIENCTVYIKGAVVQFTSTESAILILLLQYPQKFFQSRIFMNRSGRKNMPMTMIQLIRILATFVKK